MSRVGKNITVSIDRLRQLGHRPGNPRRIKADAATCPKCDSHYAADEMHRNLRVCPACGHHFGMTARERLENLGGPGGYVELWPELRAADPLQFVDLKPYVDRIREAEQATGMGEAIVCAELEVRHSPAIAAVMDFTFMGGSMGAVVGEKFARACDYAAEKRLPLIVLTSSGGARMQEGTLALMQMAKTVIALDTLAEARMPTIVILAHPTTGGVWASFASLGDITYAEPGALIAFSGPRVIEETTREVLPDDFGRAERQLVHGHVDAVVDRRELAERISRVLQILRPPPAEELTNGGQALQWAQNGAERMGRMAQSLPSIPRKVLERIRPGSTDGEDGP
ncbi:MAG: acetyl-CoA carboxylase carboxyl transferase subunit beta [Thermoleophilia bacterium]|nr:acetyl-CoA carboxylase carboxyl transferase subunit beta [Thermoleophilia bacterium]